MLVIESSKRVSGQEQLDTLSSIYNLALIYRNQGLLKEAEDMGLLVIETEKRVWGQEYPGTLISMGNLASIYTDKVA